MKNALPETNFNRKKVFFGITTATTYSSIKQKLRQQAQKGRNKIKSEEEKLKHRKYE